MQSIANENKTNWRDTMNKSAALKMYNVEPKKNKNPKLPFLHNFFLQQKTPIKMKMDEDDGEAKEILDNLLQAQKELEIANRNFEFVQEQELIDFYIYQMKAAQTRYQYLLKKAKEKKINMEPLKKSKETVAE